MNQIEQTLTSMEVAEMVGKEHNKLLRDIRTYTRQLNESNIGLVDFFNEATYMDAKGEERPCFKITKKGCEFVSHKLTGIKGTEFTARYINRFHEMEEVIATPLSEIQILRQSIEILNKQDGRITKLENNMTIDHGQAQDLRKAGAKRVIQLCGSKNANAYKDLSKRIFSELWNDFKDYFHINAYSNTLIKRFDEAVNYLEQWTPSNNTLIEIRNSNSQMNLEV